jgi:hypothetical protein
MQGDRFAGLGDGPGGAICPRVAVVVTETVVARSLMRMHKATSSTALRHVEDVSPEAWEWLSETTVFFGHRSVGKNIIDGIGDLVAQRRVPNLRVFQTKDKEEIAGPMLAHAPIGQNFDPKSKITEFKKLMEGGLAKRVDVAFFKFCYVDIGVDSDLESIFAAYCQTMDSLRLQFPDVVFVHVTVPICGPPQRAKAMLKACVKRIMGRPPVLCENKLRAQYNEMLRERFSGKEPLFDLALYETLGSQGLRYYGTKDGHEVPILACEYTDDGGHLNATGRQHVADQLLLELLALANGRG